MPFEMPTPSSFRSAVPSGWRRVECPAVHVFLGVIHRSRPETPLRIALAVVEPVARTIGLGIDDRSHDARFRVEAGESALERDGQSPRFTNDDGTDRLPDGELSVRSVGRRVEMDELRRNVDPPETVSIGVPKGPFSESGTNVEDAGGGPAVRHESNGSRGKCGLGDGRPRRADGRERSSNYATGSNELVPPRAGSRSAECTDFQVSRRRRRSRSSVRSRARSS